MGASIGAGLADQNQLLVGGLSDALFYLRCSTASQKTLRFDICAATITPVATTLSFPSDVDRTITFPVDGTTVAMVEQENVWNVALQSFNDNFVVFHALADATKNAKFNCGSITTGTVREFTFPNANGTLALIDLAQTWTALQTFRDTMLKIEDDADSSKTLVFSLGGASANADLTLAWAGTTDRTLTLPDVTGTLAALNLTQTWTATQTFDVSSSNPTIIFSYSGFPSPWTQALQALGTSGGTASLPDGTYTLAGLSLVQTWTALQTFRNNTWKIVDSSDSSKTAVWSLSGASTGADLTLAWVGTADRTLTLPDVTSTLAALGLAQTFTKTQTLDGVAAGAVGVIIRGDSNTIIGFDVYDNNTGFTSHFVPNINQAADIQIDLPAVGGTLITSSGTSTLTNKTLGTTGNTLRASTASSGVAFVDNTTTSKALRMIMSGAVGNNSIAIKTTAARAYSTPDIDGFFETVAFTQTADATVANTTTETTIFGTGVGTKTLPANFWIAGRTLRVTLSGIYSTVAVTGDTVTVRVKLGSTTIASKATTALVTGGTNLYWWADTLITCRTTGASGTVMISGGVTYQIAGSAIVADELNNGAATTTIDTTASAALDVTVQHSAANASNTIKSIVGAVAVLN